MRHGGMKKSKSFAIRTPTFIRSNAYALCRHKVSFVLDQHDKLLRFAKRKAPRRAIPRLMGDENWILCPMHLYQEVFKPIDYVMLPPGVAAARGRG